MEMGRTVDTFWSNTSPSRLAIILSSSAMERPAQWVNNGTRGVKNRRTKDHRLRHLESQMNVSESERQSRLTMQMEGGGAGDQQTNRTTSAVSVEAQSPVSSSGSSNSSSARDLDTLGKECPELLSHVLTFYLRSIRPRPYDPAAGL